MEKLFKDIISNLNACGPKHKVGEGLRLTGQSRDNKGYLCGGDIQFTPDEPAKPDSWSFKSYKPQTLTQLQNTRKSQIPKSFINFRAENINKVIKVQTDSNNWQFLIKVQNSKLDHSPKCGCECSSGVRCFSVKFV